MEPVKVTGMVLSVMPVGENDRRLVLLTAERGKIHGFARGARRPRSSLTAAAQPFVYGEFMVYEGRNAYTFASARVLEYFDSLRGDVEAVCCGSYFLELADYFARENEEDSLMLRLLLAAVKALCRGAVPKRIIRAAFEIKMLQVNGIAPESFACAVCGSRENLTVFSASHHGMLCREHAPQAGLSGVAFEGAAVYTFQYVLSHPPEQIFSFNLTDRVYRQVSSALDHYFHQVIDRHFKSLEMLEAMYGQ